ncbi:hypothetical protein ACJMK2_020080 [Sinanodonta woodiana]|uniref:Fungal-type protein kinase domain-containing protein n=1 Tax=Sinanodonta woodiana TaxID=1069815 RepID=A0ABD3TYV4_SINWO
MILLLQSQSSPLKANSPNGRRWNKKVISICLALWVRSPRTYQDIVDSTMMILPTGRHLRRYKNRVPQEAGPQDEVFLWMYQAANDANVPDEGFADGLIHNETKIQQDLVLDTRGGKLHLVPNLSLSNISLKASELHIMIWDVIARLQDWVFFVDYILQDGGEENRPFFKSHFNGNPSDSKYMNPNKLFAMSQDFSYNMRKKKIRNGIMKNGDIRGLHTRKLKLNEKYILWKHWISAIHWDQEVHSRPIHHKVSDAHLYPNSAEKIQNHLAEEMLGSNTLFLMKSYQASLPDGKTSKMISIFRDHMRSVKNVHDEHLQCLYNILQWFTNWRISVNYDESKAKGRRSKILLID